MVSYSSIEMDFVKIDFSKRCFVTTPYEAKEMTHARYFTTPPTSCHGASSKARVIK